MVLIYIMAVICSFCVANLYYCQPILMIMANSLNVDYMQIGNLPTILQLSYAAGLLFLVPLGDKLNRKILLQILLMINLMASIIIAVSNSFYLLEAMIFLVGISSIGAQIIIPAVSFYVDKRYQGKAIGILLSGLVSGILFARLFSGFISEIWSWQTVFFIASFIDFCIIIFIKYKFPANKNNNTIGYFTLIRSTIELFLHESKLRLSCLSGFLIFGAYSSLWGNIAYLTSSTFHLSSNEIGLLGLSGIAGIIVSPYIGKMADKYNANFVVIIGSIVSLCGFVIMYFSINNILFLFISMLLLDISARHSIIGNQIRIFSLNFNARSRLNTAFMTSYFLGGAFFTKLGNMLIIDCGWIGLVFLGIISSLIVIFINKNSFYLKK